MKSPGILPSEPVAKGHRPCRLADVIDIRRAPVETYLFWRNFPNLAEASRNIKSINWEAAEVVSRWHLIGPCNTPLVWEAVLINDKPGRLIAWQTINRNGVKAAGTIRFTPLDRPGWTRVRFRINCYLPIDSATSWLSLLLRPEKTLSNTLAQIKSYLEKDHPLADT